MARARGISLAVVLILLGVIGTQAITAGPAAASGPTIQFSGSYTSTLGTHSVTLNWTTNSQPSYCSIYIYESVGCETASGSKTIAVSAGGRLSYDLDAVLNGVTGTQPLSVDVPVPSPPVLTTHGQGTDPTTMSVDMFSYKEIHTQAQPTLYWTAGGSSAAPTTELQVGRPNSQGQTVWGPWQVESGTSYPIPQTDLTTPTTTYQLRSCDTTSSPVFCSGNAVAKVNLVGAQPQCPSVSTTCTAGTPSYRDYVPAGGSTTIGWDDPTATTPGNFWDVAYGGDGPAGGGITTQQTYSVPTQQAGVVDIWLESCDLTSFNPPAASCGPTKPITSPVSGTVTSILPANQYVLAIGQFGETVATITDSSGQSHPVTTPASGILNSVGAGITQGQTVTQGQTLFNVATQLTQQELVVGSTTTWQFQPWTNSFNTTGSQAYPLWVDGRVGAPDDVAFSPQGNVFVDSEFSSAMAEVDPNSVATPTSITNGRNVAVHNIPLYQTFNSQTGLFQPTQPYENGFVSSGNTNLSELGEQITSAQGKIWFTQGGWGCNDSSCSRFNHSRIVSYDPTAAPDPTQVDDSRFCAYSVPGNNNSVTGITSDGTRIWFTEQGSTSLDWFDPSQLSCQNELDYSQVNPDNTVKGQNSYCPTNTTTGNCVHQIPECTNPSTVSPCIPATVGDELSELTYDPNGPNGVPSIWYGTLLGGQLGEVDFNPSNGSVCATCITSYALPQGDNGQIFSGAWQIRTDQNYVYVAQFGGDDIARFDKATKSFPSGDAGQIRLPAADNATVFSLAISNGRLYFTSSGALPNNTAAIGYINLSSWNTGSPTGVMYTGLQSLVDPTRAQQSGSSFNGISIDPSTGEIAVGDYSREQVVVLAPNPSTSVIIPSNGATITGSPLLDAIATDSSGSISKVQFYLTGGSLNNELIGTATPTLYGWLSNSWNSTSVPDGTYKITSVATDSGGNVGTSDPVTVTVGN
jgi:hypothetical protein